jgi:hypothetical protein
MPASLVRLVVELHAAALLHRARLDTPPNHDVAANGGAWRDRGQATTEYALIMLAAALVALLVVAWATAGGGAGRIGQLFDRVIDSVLDRV